MRAKQYDADNVITLPRLQSSGAMALGKQLAAAAKAHKKDLPKGVAKALGNLEKATGALAAALRDQAGTEEAADSDELRKLDRNLDACWSGLHDFLTGIGKIPGSNEAAEARALDKTIFDQGLAFILLPYELEWAQSEVRLDRIDSQGLAPRLQKLDGQRFLDALAKAHAAYGKALGMTHPVAKVAASTPSVREPLDAFGVALRHYIAKVMGSVELDEPETQALADALLAPLASWSVGAGRKAAADATGGADAAPAPADAGAKPVKEPA